MTNKSIEMKVSADLGLIPEDRPSERFIEITLKTPQATHGRNRQPLNLALVIDKSGSMQGDKLEYAKQAAMHVLGLLTDRDQLAIIAFDSEIEILHPSALVDAGYKQQARSRIASLQAGTMTNLGGGWLLGCEQIASHPLEGSLQRALLLTDGLANEGITSPEELSGHARQLHARGIATSTFGVGTDYDHFLLELMANNGGGKYYYIKDPEEIPQLFRIELEELTTITAADTRISVELPANVSVEVLGSWETEKTENQITVHLGDIPEDQTERVCLRLLCPPVGKDNLIKLEAEAKAKGEDGGGLLAKASLELAYATMEKVNAAKVNDGVRNESASVLMAGASRQALELEQAGRYQEAKQSIETALLKHGTYLTSEKQKEYEELKERVARALDPMSRKLFHSTSHMSSRSRLRKDRR